MDSNLDQFYKIAFKYNFEISEIFISKVAYAVLSALNFMKSKGFFKIHKCLNKNFKYQLRLYSSWYKTF